MGHYVRNALGGWSRALDNISTSFESQEVSPSRFLQSGRSSNAFQQEKYAFIIDNRALRGSVRALDNEDSCQGWPLLARTGRTPRGNFRILS